MPLGDSLHSGGAVASAHVCTPDVLQAQHVYAQRGHNRVSFAQNVPAVGAMPMA